MFRLGLILFIAVFFTSCLSTKSVADSKQEAFADSYETYQIMVQFKSEEGLKRTLYELSKLSLEVKEEVSATSFMYLLQLNAKPYAIDGTVDKIGLLKDVDWAKRVMR
jgi:hypothetical protein